MLKILLRKVLGRSCLNQDELNTILCDAESIINSRPLIYLSEDPDDLIALSPSMFLQDIKEIGVPDFDLIDSKKLNKRLLYKQKICQDLRLRFRNEYLGQLRDFSKNSEEPSISEGDIVLVGDTNTKRINWPLAKILKTFPSKDGRVRVVEVKTRNGKFLRPIQRLYPLEVSDRHPPDFRSQIDAGEHSPEETIIPQVPDSEGPQEPVAQCSRYGRILKLPKRLNL
ncbi:uncharacterized protein [Parasteatoda tepidariorum]|uniref:uncharacterized protein n=1 Tax=Parasteatoda tepidariorum TaxID=114398 RepID=UPI00077F90FE|nr:uncharacterized protein LOC107446175 [Parasteatoda tepidariorum]